MALTWFPSRRRLSSAPGFVPKKVIPRVVLMKLQVLLVAEESKVAKIKGKCMLTVILRD